MIWLAALSAVTAKPAASASPTVVVEATATVKILSGVQLNLNSATNPGAPQAHDSKVTADGDLRPARLIEFE